MSNSSDDKLLDDYLSGAAPYSAHYRRVESDEVPAELDRAVLQEATRDARGRRSEMWLRITPVLAIAATAVLTISIVMRGGMQSSAPNQKSLATAESVEGSSRQLEREAPAQEPLGSPSVSKPNEVPTKKDAGLARLQSTERDTAVDKIELPKVTSIAPQQKPAPQPFALKDESRAKLDESTNAAENKPAALRQSAPTFALRTKREEKTKESAQVASSFAQSPPPVSNDQRAAGIAAGAAAPSASIDANQLARRATSQDERTRAVAKESLELNEAVVTGQVMRKGVEDVGVPISVVSQESLDARDVNRSKPSEWLQYIRKLRSQGKATAANEEWKNFVETYPRFSVAKSDTARPPEQRK